MGIFRHNTLFAFYYNVSFLKIPIMVGTLPCHKAAIQIDDIECWADRSTLQWHSCDKDCPQGGFLSASSLSLLPGLPDLSCPSLLLALFSYWLFLLVSLVKQSATSRAGKIIMVGEFGL